MSRTPERPFRAALLVALLCAAGIIAAQAVATVFPLVGDSIRHLPLIPIALAAVTVLVVIQLIRAR
ncbi:MAG: hypothetical protein ACR2JL_03850 [Candidatus Limnocylindrus sp.]